MARFFVMHLSERDLTERGRSSSGQPFEIQLLDAENRAKATGYVGVDEKTLEVEGYSVPMAVIDAARRQTEGQGDYVDGNGNSIPPF